MFRDQEEAFKAVRESSKRASEHCSAALAFANRFRPHGLTDWHLPSDSNVSMASILIEAGLATKLAKSLTPTRAANMPAARLNELNGTLAALSTALEKFLATGAEAEKDNRPLKYFKDGKVAGSLTNEQYYDFGEIISEVFHRIEGVRNATALIGLVVHDFKSEERYEQSVSQIARKASKSADDLEALLDSAGSQAEALKQMVEQAGREHETLTEAWNKKQQTFDEMAGGADSAKGQLEAVRDEIASIKTDIDDTQAQLQKSAVSADEKIEEISSFHSDLSKVRAELEGLRTRADEGDKTQREYVARVEALIAEAESMVSGATTAGLAKAFDEERTRLSTDMKWALFSFLIGIGFLFVTTILLAAYVFEIPISIFGYNVGQVGTTPERGDEITLAGVLSRTVILLAPFWLTLFSSRRYRNLFDLRQQYTHKYSMAFSVDGFKQQAPQYAEQMAAWVFHVVSEPPVTVKSSKGMGDNPLPDIHSAVKDQLERFGILKSTNPADQ